MHFDSDNFNFGVFFFLFLLLFILFVCPVLFIYPRYDFGPSGLVIVVSWKKHLILPKVKRKARKICFAYNIIEFNKANILIPLQKVI